MKPGPFHREGARTVLTLLMVLPLLAVIFVVVRDRSRLAGQLKELETRTLEMERLQDPRELALIRNVSPGESIADMTELRMLADDRLRRDDPHFELALSLFSEASQSRADDCEILNFDLFSLEGEGTKQYLILIRDCEVVEIVTGYSVNS